MKIKILIITSGLTAGGVDSLILNTLSVMDKDKYHIDFLIFDDSPCDWREKFEAYGCKVIVTNRARKMGLVKTIKNYRKIFIEGHYNIVHSHIGYGSIYPVIACKGINSVKVITHAHFDNYPVNSVVKFLGHLIFNTFPCRRLACSYGAGKALYGKKSKFEFVKNGIDTNKFVFDQAVRTMVHKELGISGETFVIGTVGRMQYQKNHEFLLDIFNEIQKSVPNSILLLVGDGELKEDIKNKANLLGILEKIQFLGIRNDVNRILQAMDVFIMPTRFEGLSLALLEVESSGLPCLTSDVVPKEAKVVNNFEFLSLNDSPKVWAERALHYRAIPRDRGDVFVHNAGFDKVDSARKWFSIYDEEYQK